MKAKATIITAILLTTVLIFAAACGSVNSAAPAGNASSSSGANDIGNGSNVFLFEVTDDEGNVSAWNVHTNAATVGAALVEVGLIEGEEHDFGLMVSHVNGLRADYVEDGAWWSFHIDGEMAMEGVDTTDIKEGVTYAFVYTEA